METVVSTQGQFTSLLTNQQLAVVERLRVNPTRRFTNRSHGEHLHGKGGSSIEFADYRNYVAGDDIRFVDWNIFSRLHRPYLKQYHQEEELHIVLLVDASESMLFENKLQRAQQLAAAFGVIGLLATERVSAHVFNQPDGKTSFIGPLVGRGNMRELFAFLENIETGGAGPVEQGIEAMLKRHRGRGAVVICSDFMTTGDLRRATNMLFSRGLEIFGLQVLGPTEIDPDITGDMRLIDSETDDVLDVSAAGDLAVIYQEYRAAFQRDLEAICQQRSGRLVTVSAGEALEFVLFDQLRRKGWVTS